MKSALLQDLKYRGLIHDATDLEGLDELMSNEQVTVYVGFDPTADSLHIGHLLPIIMLKRFQQAGHKPIALIGGATGMIGDPSGRTTERQLQSVETIQENVKAIKNQLTKYLDFDGDNAAIIVNNYDWTHNLSVLDFLRDYGKHFGINYMLAKETIASRLETGISYTEFSYTILQAMDFNYLFKTYNCRLQVGGSDQWGNIISGLDLIRKLHGQEEKVYGLTVPLVTKADGSKFGKTAEGTIWLDPKKTIPYELYQFFINTADEDVIHFLKIFTFLEREEIEALEEKVKTEPHLREAQKTLAREVVTFVHGERAYEQAVRITEALFSGDVKQLDKREIETAFKGVPSIELGEPTDIVTALVLCGAASSKRQAREFLSNNSIRVNGEAINDMNLTVDRSVAIGDDYVVIRRGKKNYYLIRLGF